MRILGSFSVPLPMGGTRCCFLCELSQEFLWGRAHAGSKQDVESESYVLVFASKLQDSSKNQRILQWEQTQNW